MVEILAATNCKNVYILYTRFISKPYFSANRIQLVTLFGSKVEYTFYFIRNDDKINILNFGQKWTFSNDVL